MSDMPTNCTLWTTSWLLCHQPVRHNQYNRCYVVTRCGVINLTCVI